MQLQQIDRVKTITKEDFLKNYFKPQKPVVIERFVEDWPAFKFRRISQTLGYVTFNKICMSK